MKIKKLTAVLLLLLLVLAAGSALAEITPLADFNYMRLEGGLLLQKYKGTSTAVHVAGSYEIEGTAYGVTLDTASVFRNNTKITSVELDGGIRFATTEGDSLRKNSMKGLFQGCQGLVSVDLSKISTAGVTDMSYLFSNCRKLKAVDFSNFDTSAVTTLEWLLDYCMSLNNLTGYENWNTGKVESIYKTFNRVSYNYSADSYRDTRQQKIDISRWDLSKVKNSGWCFQNCRTNAILLPDNLAVISAGFLNHAAQLEGSSFTVPAGVSIPSTMVSIAPSQIVKLNRMTDKYSTFKITVHEGNPVYYVDEKGHLNERPNVFGAEVTLDNDTFTYDGTEKRPTLVVKTGSGTALMEGTDYTVTFLNNVDAGTGVVRIEGMGDYLGTIEIPFTILPKDIAGTPLRLLAQLVWTGENQTQPFEVELPDGAWTVSGNTACDVGVYRLTVQGTGNYTGSVSCLYEIAPDTALLDRLNKQNVTQAHLPQLLRIRAMMANARTELADEDTLARYAAITEKCEMLIAMLNAERIEQLPATGDAHVPALWWGMLLLSAALLRLAGQEKRRMG